MPELVIHREQTALLIMDYENDVLEMVPTAREWGAVYRAQRVLQEARQAGLLIGYVVVRFREGYPEVGPRDPARLRVKEAGILKEGTSGADVVAELAPGPSELVFTKRRTGPFPHTDLDLTLRARGIQDLVLMGVNTSGVVLSTVRAASDLDYRLIVLEDCCADVNLEIHQCLINLVLPKQATVVSSEEFLKALASG